MSGKKLIRSDDGEDTYDWVRLKSRPCKVIEKASGKVLECRFVRYIDGRVYLHCPKRFILLWDKCRGRFQEVKE